MDRRVKFSFNQKLRISKAISTGRESHLSAARKLGCNKSTVRQWTRLFEKYGSDGLRIRNGSYEGIFKVKVVCYMLKHHLSLKETAAYFGIPRDPVVGRWVKIYQRIGEAGLLCENRGRKKSTRMGKKANKKQTSGTDPSVERIASLEKELELLRAENAFLKKLDALIQQEKAAKVQARRQKPSRN